MRSARFIEVPGDIWAVLRANVGAWEEVDDGGRHFILATAQGLFAVYDRDTRPSSTATCLACRSVYDVTYDQGRCQNCDDEAWSYRSGQAWWRRQ